MPVRAAAAEFILEGLYAHRRISRSEERGFTEERNAESAERDDAAKRAARQQLATVRTAEHEAMKWVRYSNTPATISASRRGPAARALRLLVVERLRTNPYMQFSE